VAFETGADARYVRLMSKAEIYLDYNATAPASPAVRRAVAAALEAPGNASSVHAAGRAARRTVEAARAQVAALVGVRAEEIVFTSGGTEANALAIAGAPAASVIVSSIEHDSVLAAAQAQARPHFFCPVDESGVVDPGALESILAEAPAPALVSLMLANNETGVVQPVGEAAERVHAHGGVLHTDAIQAPGRLPLDLPALGVDLASLSGHKMGAPQGIGALWVREGLGLEPLLRGGGQELRRRAGTENLPGIAGFGVAAEEAGAALEDVQRLQALRDRLEAGLQKRAPEVRIFGQDAPRLPNTVTVAMPGMTAETQVMAFDLEGICISAGSACSSGKVQASHVLQAMGVGETEAGAAIRVSLGAGTSEAEIDRFLEVWHRLCARARARRESAA